LVSELDILTNQYKNLAANYLDLERLNLYLISHHSTAIEGSTLTALETEIFLEKGLTAKGKPFEHHLMVKDHYSALRFVFEEDRQPYIESLIATRKEENIDYFLDFMKSQHIKFLKEEIKKLENNKEPKSTINRNIRLVF